MCSSFTHIGASWGSQEAHKITPETITLLKRQALRDGDGDTIVYLKLFTPDANATWWITEWHVEDGNALLFGLCDLGMGFPELGYVRLNEVVDLKGPLGLPIERDLYWQPRPLSEVMDNHGR